MAEKGLKDFYSEIIEKLTEFDKRLKPEIIIAASPAFWKKELDKRLPAELKKKIKFATCSGVDTTALNEVIRSPETQEALHSARVAKESDAVHSLLTAISKNAPVAYGIDEVSSAVEAGAVSNLLVLDKFLRENVEAVEHRVCHPCRQTLCST